MARLAAPQADIAAIVGSRSGHTLNKVQILRTFCLRTFCLGTLSTKHLRFPSPEKSGLAGLKNRFQNQIHEFPVFNFCFRHRLRESMYSAKYIYFQWGMMYTTCARQKNVGPAGPFNFASVKFEDAVNVYSLLLLVLLSSVRIEKVVSVCVCLL